MSLQAALLAFLVISFALLLLLSVLVVGRKLARDHDELLSATRRDRIAACLHEGDRIDVTALVVEVHGDAHAQLDLLAVLGRLGAELPASRRGQLHRAAERFGLVAGLIDLLDDDDCVTRGRAALLLGRLGADAACDYIAERIADLDPDVRLAACAALGHLATDTAARALVRAIAERRLPAERLVERLDGAWAVDALLDGLRTTMTFERSAATDAGAPARASFARALGLIGAPAAQTALLRLLRTGCVEERISAARALGTCGAAASVAALAGALRDDAWQVRVQAARSAGRLHADVLAPVLGGLLADDAWWVRAAAAEGLHDLGATGEQVLRRALTHSDRFARDRAREQLALSAMHDEPALALAWSAA